MPSRYRASGDSPSTGLFSNLFDAFGRRQRIERNANTGSITTFTPDGISRLASIAHNVDGTATGNDLGIGFSYNPASQVVARSQTNSLYDHQIPVVNQVYTRNGLNQYPSISGTNGGTLSWDLNGNLKSDGLPIPTNYVYDAENRLVSASGAKNATLTYDPMGRLYQVADAAGNQRFLYDGDRLILEYNGSGVVQRRYAHGAGVDEPMVWYEGSTVSSANRRYMHADHQGSIVNVTGAAGNTLLVGAYDAYGVTTTNVGRFQYTGQTAIQQVGLYYYKARFYNPSLGRFMQTDPIGYDDDVNLYAYAAGDPINGTDPTGNACVNCVSGAVAGTVGFVVRTLVNAGAQLLDKGSVNVPDALTAGATAGVASTIIGFNPSAASNPAVVAGISGVVNVAGSVTEDVVEGKDVDIGKAGTAGVAGAIGGPIGAKVGAELGKRIGRAAGETSGEVLGAAAGEGASAGLSIAGNAMSRGLDAISEAASAVTASVKDAVDRVVDPQRRAK